MSFGELMLEIHSELERMAPHRFGEVVVESVGSTHLLRGLIPAADEAVGVHLEAFQIARAGQLRYGDVPCPEEQRERSPSG